LPGFLRLLLRPPELRLEIEILHRHRRRSSRQRITDPGHDQQTHPHRQERRHLNSQPSPRRHEQQPEVYHNPSKTANQNRSTKNPIISHRTSHPKTQTRYKNLHSTIHQRTQTMKRTYTTQTTAFHRLAETDETGHF
ncbi:MAG: hypothetical protein NWE83_14345, partial [Candidatus Bathyarchaeota archaeon]|nr:hypothetical protein [Candidatus Bathyarchaeota archaeon]